MQVHVRPKNYFLIIACALSAFLYIFGLINAIQFISGNKQDGSWTWPVFILQIALCIFVGIVFALLLKYSRFRSYGHNSKTWNRFQIKLYGAFTTIFLILGAISTALQMDKFLYIGAFFFYAAFVSSVMLLVIWRREQNVKTFVERVLHANSMSNSHVTEQNARDLYRLRECDKDFMVMVECCRFSNERQAIEGIRHSEYFHLQKWLKELEDVLGGKTESEVLTEIHKEMTKRTEIFGLDSTHERRYQQLASMSHLIMPIELDETEKTLNRDSSFFMHSKPDTTV